MHKRLVTKFLATGSAITLSGWFLICAVFVSAFLHLYNLQNNYMFQGDQGRDASIVADIFRKKDLVFIGPVTSIGNMYLGPLYYYFMLPWLFLSYPNPIGPAVAVAIMGICTVALVYILGKELVGEKAALLATWMYLLSATFTFHSRFSWNPNPAPLVSLVLVYALSRVSKNVSWWIAVAACVSILIQLHYVTLLTAAAAGIVWLWQFTIQPEHRKKLLGFSAVSAGIVIAFATPLLLFDAKHGWLNARAFAQLVTGKGSFSEVATEYTVIQKIGISLAETHGRSLHVFFETVFGQYRLVESIALVVLVIMLISMVSSRIIRKKMPGLPTLLIVIAVSIVGLGFYRGTVYDHYVAFLFPISTLLLAAAVSIVNTTLPGKLLSAGFLGIILVLNVVRFPLADADWKPSDIQAAAQTIVDRVTPGEKYNSILVSDSRDYYGANYRYFLSASSKPPIQVGSNESVESLFIIDETKGRIKATDLPTYEIVVFSNKEPVEQYTAPNDGPIISVLKQTHN